METAPRKSVRYEVRSAGGTLFYDTFIHVEQAYLAGLIESTDELRQEGDASWKKVADVPQLARLHKSEKTIEGQYVGWIIGSVALAVAALIAWGRGYWLVALVIAAVLSTVLFRLTAKAQRIKK